MERRWNPCVDEMMELRKETLSKTSGWVSTSQQERPVRLLGNFFSVEGAYPFSR